VLAIVAASGFRLVRGLLAGRGEEGELQASGIT
jgi:hypothetical protein